MVGGQGDVGSSDHFTCERSQTKHEQMSWEKKQTLSVRYKINQVVM